MKLGRALILLALVSALHGQCDNPAGGLYDPAKGRAHRFALRWIPMLQGVLTMMLRRVLLHSFLLCQGQCDNPAGGLCDPAKERAQRFAFDGCKECLL
jgi:hypothetical protein